MKDIDELKVFLMRYIGETNKVEYIVEGDKIIVKLDRKYLSEKPNHYNFFLKETTQERYRKVELARYHITHLED